MNLYIACALVALTSAAIAAEPTTPTGFVVGKKLSIRSSVLGEDRPLQIFIPENYESAKSSYPTLPVLYLLDGSDHFTHVTGLIDYFAKDGRILPMIVVAVGNTDRTRDFTPTRCMIDGFGKSNEDQTTSGGAGKFVEFLRSELIPYVDSNYRTAPFRILFGHSLGGLFAVKVMMENPDMFQAYFAVSPSLWWDHQMMLKSSGPIGHAKQFLFISVADEGGNHQASINRFVAQIKKRAAPGFAWKFKTYHDEGHMSVPHTSLYDGLKFLFSRWTMLDGSVDAGPPTYSQIAKYYRELSDKFGYNIPLPLARINDIAAGYADFHRIDEAIAVSQEAVKQYTESASAYEVLADNYTKKGDKPSAIKNYEAALKLDPKSEAAKKGLEKLKK
ncbi:MAG: alpha/beta hydrolase [Verrucomicrobia bacterium]|nr:alpha/beta hydrolase [Verrucomicrobiota bacterium]